MSSSVPCLQAYNLAVSAVSFGSLTVILGCTVFGLYTFTLHKNPSFRFNSNTKFDIESSSWLIILTALSSMSSSLAAITNYDCGATCPTATVNCNTQSATYGSALIVAISASSAAGMKIASYYYQVYVMKGLAPATDV